MSDTTEPIAAPSDPVATARAQSPSGRAEPGALGWIKVWVIGLSGLLPFVVTLVGVIYGDQDWDQRFVAAMVVYGALVATFSAGVRWGAEIAAADTEKSLPDLGRLLRCAPPLVLGLLAVLLLDVAWLMSIVMIILTGLALLAWDLKATQTGLLPRWMAPFRVTAAVLAILLMAATASIAARQPQQLPPATSGAVQPDVATDQIQP